MPHRNIPGNVGRCDAMFVCGTPLENSAGMDGLVRGNFAKSKELLKEAGYDGTPIVMLHTTDIAVLTKDRKSTRLNSSH